MLVSLIAAVAENGVIGRGGALCWRLPSDMKRFRRLTTGHHVIMGRKTWESLGRPLKDRVNVVLTRRPDYVAEGARVERSLEAALDLARAAGDEEAFVIGGEEIYRLAVPLADRIHLSRVHGHYEGDAFFPELAEGEWVERAREEVPADARHDARHTYQLLERRRRA